MSKGTGAPLIPITLVSPGQYGLNKQQENSILDSAWATEAYNAVFDQSGRLASRRGWTNGTSTPMSGTPVVDVIHEYIRENTTRTIISTGGSKIWSGVSAPTDVTGTATITAGDNWQFLNFNDIILGVQQGEQPIRSTGGNFADLVAGAGTAPQGNCGLAAFGRVWIAHSDYQTIKYSDLLNELTWTGGSAGAIDMSSVWPNGMDQIVALAAYNGLLVVFGQNTIVFYGDGVGSALGINPANIFVQDTIVGTGCIARDSIQQTANGDLLFLSANGVQSLRRVIQEKSNPIFNISANIRDYLAQFVAMETPSEIRSIYAQKEGYYLLILPTVSRVFCFDTRYPLQDGTYRVTEWATKIKAGVRSTDNTIYLSLSNYAGRIGTYAGNFDVDPSGNASSYDYKWISGWMDFREQQLGSYLKMFKEFSGIAYTSSNTLTVLWDFDFQGSFNSITKSVTTAGSDAEYGTAEYGIAEYGAGGILTDFRVPVNGSGQFLKVGVQVPINNTQFALQNVNLFNKIGRPTP